MRMPDCKTGSSAPKWPLWSLLWRLLVFGPILIPLGFLFLALILASLVLPPVYAVVVTMDGHCVLGPFVCLAWLGWLRFGRGFLRWLFQGIEYASL